MDKQTTEILQTKQHFETLDGLRGVAALAVVVFHFMEVVYADYSKNFIGHGFLAVDFFFCLSGFVIAYAYDDRMSKIGTVEFFKSRLIRLHPLVILGSVIGLFGFLFDPFVLQPLVYSAGKTGLIFLTSIFLIPYPVMPVRFFNLFSFNAPAWSLFWEYAANIFYAFVLYRASRKHLLIVVAIAALTVCVIVYRNGNLMGGWGKTTFWDGCARISFSFLAGMLVYRFNFIIKNKLGFAALAIFLALAFLMPFSKWNWITEPIVVIGYFPLLIALGAGATLTGRLKKVCIFLGRISYPLYMTHYAGIWIFAGYLTSNKPTTAQLFLIVPTAVLLLIGMAWLAMVLFDVPVRKYLSDKRVKM